MLNELYHATIPEPEPAPMMPPFNAAFSIDATTLNAFPNWAINPLMVRGNPDFWFHDYVYRVFLSLTTTLRNRGWDYDAIDTLCREVSLNCHLVCVICQRQKAGNIPKRGYWKCGTCISKDRSAGRSSEVDREEARMLLFSLSADKRYV